MEIQQHDGVVVVEERGTPSGLRQAPQETRRERGRATPRGRSNHVLWAAPCLNIYRGEGGCAPFRVFPPPRGGGQP